MIQKRTATVFGCYLQPCLFRSNKMSIVGDNRINLQHFTANEVNVVECATENFDEDSFY